MRRSVVLPALGLLAGLSAFLGCAAPVPPDKPSWDVDVQPIIRGSCSHCHGETALKEAPGFRFDVCDPAAYAASGVMPQEPILGAALLAPTIVQAVVGTPKVSQMPPPPAAALSDYEITVFRSWAKVVMDAGSTQAACKKTGSNHPPTARLIGTRQDGSDLLAIVEIDDADGDQVFGRVKAGPATADVLSVGRREVRLAGASSSDKITIKISDGTDTTGDLALN